VREANFAPAYCSLYPEFAEIARKHGYALAIHGSLERDMDLVAIPWTDSASDPQAIVDAIVSEFSITQANGWTTREHGRLVTTLVFAFGDCFIDLSFMPVRAADAGEAAIWKTTHRAVCVPLTEDRAVAEQWRAAGYPVIEYFTAPPAAKVANSTSEDDREDD